MEPYYVLAVLRVHFVRTPHITLGPQMYKIYILRSSSDLTLLSSVWLVFWDRRSHRKLHVGCAALGSKMKSHVVLPTCLCISQTWILNSFSHFLAGFSAGQMQLRSAFSASPRHTAEHVRNTCAYQSNAINTQGMPKPEKVMISLLAWFPIHFGYLKKIDNLWKFFSALYTTTGVRLENNMYSW